MTFLGMHSDIYQVLLFANDLSIGYCSLKTLCRLSRTSKANYIYCRLFIRYYYEEFIKYESDEDENLSKLMCKNRLELMIEKCRSPYTGAGGFRLSSGILVNFSPELILRKDISERNLRDVALFVALGILSGELELVKVIKSIPLEFIEVLRDYIDIRFTGYIYYNPIADYINKFESDLPKLMQFCNVMITCKCTKTIYAVILAIIKNYTQNVAYDWLGRMEHIILRHILNKNYTFGIRFSIFMTLQDYFDPNTIDRILDNFLENIGVDDMYAIFEAGFRRDILCKGILYRYRERYYSIVVPFFVARYPTEHDIVFESCMANLRSVDNTIIECISRPTFPEHYRKQILRAILELIARDDFKIRHSENRTFIDPIFTSYLLTITEINDEDDLLFERLIIDRGLYKIAIAIKDAGFKYMHYYISAPKHKGFGFQGYVNMLSTLSDEPRSIFVRELTIRYNREYIHDIEDENFLVETCEILARNLENIEFVCSIYISQERLDLADKYPGTHRETILRIARLKANSAKGDIEQKLAAVKGLIDLRQTKAAMEILVEIKELRAVNLLYEISPIVAKEAYKQIIFSNLANVIRITATKTYEEHYKDIEKIYDRLLKDSDPNMRRWASDSLLELEKVKRKEKK